MTAARPAVLEAARAYLERGWQPVALRAPALGAEGTGKPPVRGGWQRRRYADAGAFARDLPPGGNVGLALGLASGGLVDVDLDDEHALRLAPAFVPPTPLRSGRASSPDAHWWYRCALDETTARRTAFDDRGGAGMLVELRAGGGAQTVAPPSVHYTGEVVAWSEGLVDPAQVELVELRAACGRLAVAALLAHRGWADEAAVACARSEDLAGAPDDVLALARRWRVVAPKAALPALSVLAGGRPGRARPTDAARDPAREAFRAAVLAATPVDRVLALLGRPAVGAGARGDCVFGHAAREDGSPGSSRTFAVALDGATWACHSARCSGPRPQGSRSAGAAGDAVGLFAAVRGLDYGAALRELADLAGVDDPADAAGLPALGLASEGAAPSDETREADRAELLAAALDPAQAAPGTVALDRSPTGAGKTYATLRALAALEDAGGTLYLTDSHRAARERAFEGEALGLPLAVRPRLTRPGERPDEADGIYPCEAGKAGLIERDRERGWSSAPTCASCPLARGAPGAVDGGPRCRYLRALRAWEAAPARVAPAQWAALAPQGYEGVSRLVVDDASAAAFVLEHAADASALRAFASAARVAADRAEAGALGAAVAALDEDEVRRAAERARGLRVAAVVAERVAAALKAAGTDPTPAPLAPPEVDDEERQALAVIAGGTGVLVALARAAADNAARNMLPLVEALASDAAPWGVVARGLGQWRVRRPPPERPAVLVLDATADRDYLAAWTGRRVLELPALPPGGGPLEVVEVAGLSHSRTWFGLPTDLDAARVAEAAERVAALARRTRARSVALVAVAAVEEALVAAVRGRLTGGADAGSAPVVVSAHYGATRGRNDLGGVDLAVLLGPPEPAPEAVALAALDLGERDPATLAARRRWFESTAGRRTFGYAGGANATALAALRDSELVQAVGRWAGRRDRPGLVVALGCAVPPGLPGVAAHRVTDAALALDPGGRAAYDATTRGRTQADRRAAAARAWFGGLATRTEPSRKGGGGPRPVAAAQVAGATSDRVEPAVSFPTEYSVRNDTPGSTLPALAELVETVGVRPAARAVGASHAAVRRWANGERPTPPSVAAAALAAWRAELEARATAAAADRATASAVAVARRELAATADALYRRAGDLRTPGAQGGALRLAAFEVDRVTRDLGAERLEPAAALERARALVEPAAADLAGGLAPDDPAAVEREDQAEREALAWASAQPAASPEALGNLGRTYGETPRVEAGEWRPDELFGAMPERVRGALRPGSAELLGALPAGHAGRELLAALGPDAPAWLEARHRAELEAAGDPRAAAYAASLAAQFGGGAALRPLEGEVRALELFEVAFARVEAESAAVALLALDDPDAAGPRARVEAALLRGAALATVAEHTRRVFADPLLAAA